MGMGHVVKKQWDIKFDIAKKLYNVTEKRAIYICVGPFLRHNYYYENNENKLILELVMYILKVTIE